MNEQKKIFEERYADRQQANKQTILAFIGSNRDMRQIATALLAIQCPTPIKHNSKVQQFQHLLDSSIVSVDIPPIKLDLNECQLNPKPSSRMCSERKPILQEVPKQSYEQDSIIVQPTNSPLDASFHETKITNIQAPTFRVATQSGGFICGFQTSTKHMQKVQSDIKALRTFRHNVRDKTEQNHYQNTFSTQMEKMSKAFTDRIKSLEKSLQEFKLREQSHLRTIDRLNKEVSTLTSSISQLSRYKNSSLNVSEAEYLAMENKTLREKLERRHNQSDRDISMTHRVWGMSLPVDVQSKSRYAPIVLRHRYELKTKKQILRNKDLLFKDEYIEVGYICSKQNGIKITIFCTVTDLVTSFSTTVRILKGLSGLTNNLHVEDCSPNRQEKQIINIALPQSPYEFTMPEMQVAIRTVEGELTRHITLPATIWKFFDVGSTTLSQFNTRFKSNKGNRYVTEEVTLSKKIIKNHKSLLQYIPKAMVLHPQKLLDFQESKCKLKMGYQAILGGQKLLIKLVISPMGTLYVQCVGEGQQHPGTGYLVECYLSEMLALFGREKGDI